MLVIWLYANVSLFITLIQAGIFADINLLSENAFSQILKTQLGIVIAVKRLSLNALFHILVIVFGKVMLVSL